MSTRVKIVSTARTIDFLEDSINESIEELELQGYKVEPNVRVTNLYTDDTNLDLRRVGIINYTR